MSAEIKIRPIRICFVLGPENEPLILRDLATYICEQEVQIVKRIEEADLIVFDDWVFEFEQGFYPGKTYVYLHGMRPFEQRPALSENIMVVPVSETMSRFPGIIQDLRQNYLDNFKTVEA